MKPSIIKSPVISEKALASAEQGAYVFYVDQHANKPEVAKAVAALFKVKVADVRMVHLPKKPKRFRGVKGATSAKKKALVTLKKGEKIDLFEGAK